MKLYTERFPSAEMRWFFRGKIPDIIHEWKHAVGQFRDEPQRIDTYLLLSGSNQIGLKLREGNLEFKYFVSSDQSTLQLGNLTGRLSYWEKLSMKLENSSLSSVDYPDIIEVAKERFLKFFRWDPLENKLKTGNTENIGAQLEVSKLIILGESFWTFGIEAQTGNDNYDLMRGIIRQTIELITTLQESHPVTFPVDSIDEASYPEFLQKLLHQKLSSCR